MERAGQVSGESPCFINWLIACDFFPNIYLQLLDEEETSSKMVLPLSTCLGEILSDHDNSNTWGHDMNKRCSDFRMSSAIQSLLLGNDLAHGSVVSQFWRRTSGKNNLRFRVENNKVKWTPGVTLSKAAELHRGWLIPG